MKRSQIERAIESLENEKAILQLAIDKLKQQQNAKAPRSVRKLKPVVSTDRPA